MKVSKAILAVAAGVLMSGAALAQDQAAVTAEKTTGVKTLIPGAYANVQVRHYSLRRMEKDKVVSDAPNLEVRPVIGAELWDGKVDQAFLWIFSKKADTTAIAKDALASITTVKALSGKYGFIGPYAETYQANGVSFSESYVGLYGEANHEIPTALGALAFSGWGQWNGIINSGRAAAADKSEPEIKTGRESFSLEENEDGKVNNRDLKLIALQAVGVKLKPSAVPGFSVGAEIEHDRDWFPKYQIVDVVGDDRQELAGYSTTGMTISKFNLGYKLSDAVSLTNSMRFKTVGFYEEGLDKSDAKEGRMISTSRWENRLVLAATLY